MPSGCKAFEVFDFCQEKHRDQDTWKKATAQSACLKI